MYKTFLLLARLATVLALVVIVLGAWVRLTDAGLGCPDWPGCYGRLIVSEAAVTDPGVEGLLDVRPMDAGKAWREMIHRYLASTLGLVCIALAALGWFNRRDPRQPWRLPFALVGLVVFQGLLGMWTVTLLLKPVVVVAHLLGGFATLAVLFSLARWRGTPAPIGAAPGLTRFAVAGLAVLVVQVALGGWTSANYAALACPDFPTCQTQWWPGIADFNEGFVLWRGIGIDYEGGVLDHPARVAVHFVHRLGAVVTALVLGLLAWRLMRRPGARLDGIAIMGALAVQIALGISIVVLGVPLSAAVAHNGMAALLLLTIINANQRIRQY